MSDIRELIRLLDETSLQEVRVEAGDLKVLLRKPDVPPAHPAAAPSAAAPPAPPAAPQEERPKSAPEAPAEDAGTAVITSPMVGTFYRASAPGAAPYVEVGSRITEKTVVCIVEAMKLMNEIEADVRGEIVDILAENGHLVEYGQPLFRVRVG